MSGFSALFSAFDLTFCLVLSCTHGSLPALEDKLGCYPRGRRGVVCVYKMLDAIFLGSLLRRDSKDACKLGVSVEAASLEVIYSNCFLAILFCIFYLLD